MVAEAEFEVATDRHGLDGVYTGGPARARRIMALGDSRSRLFSSYKVLLHGQFASSDSNPVPCRADIEALLRGAGATVVAELPPNAFESCLKAKSCTWLMIVDGGGGAATASSSSPSATVMTKVEKGGNPSRLNTASVKWFLDCVGGYKLQPLPSLASTLVGTIS